MFKRGETYTFQYTLPFDTDELDKLELVCVQKGVEKLYKQKAAITKEGKVISYQLTEAESLAFDAGIIRIQINFKRDGDVEKSDEISDYAVEPLRSVTI